MILLYNKMDLLLKCMREFTVNNATNDMKVQFDQKILWKAS